MKRIFLILFSLIFISCYNNSTNRLLESSKQFEMDDEMYHEFVYTVTNNTANINSMLNKV